MNADSFVHRKTLQNQSERICVAI